MKKHFTTIGLTVFAVSLFLGSCKARFYTPNRNPVPLYKNAGDAYFDASTNLLNKADFTAGFAPVKGVGTYIGYHGSTMSTGSDTAEKRIQSGEMLNLGLGYFVSEDISSQFRFEIYGDLGLGRFYNKVSDVGLNQYFNGNYTRIGIMPNFGYTSLDNHFAFAYSVRMSNIRFSNESVSSLSYWQDDYARYKSKASYGMVEQAMLFRVGSEKVKFQLQLASYHGINSDEVLNAIPRWNASIMVGVVLTPNLYGR